MADKEQPGNSIKKKPNGSKTKSSNGATKISKAPYDIKNPPSDVTEKRLKYIVRHITHVQQSCTLLGERLIASDEKAIGHDLIANGFIHDNSKLRGTEWLYLHDEVKDFAPEFFEAALHQHVHTNQHHPECWNGVTNMPRLYIAEMVCDWHARSSEFGTGLREYVRTTAVKRFGFKTQSKIYRDIKKYMDMLLDTAFS